MKSEQVLDKLKIERLQDQLDARIRNFCLPISVVVSGEYTSVFSGFCYWGSIETDRLQSLLLYRTYCILGENKLLATIKTSCEF